MKKIVFFIFLLLCINISAQDSYLKYKPYKYIEFDGTIASYRNVISHLNLDSTTCAFNTPNSFFTGVVAYAGNIIMRTDNGLPMKVNSWSIFNSNYVLSRDSVLDIYRFATQSALSFGLAGKANAFTGSSSQYTKGDGSYGTFPTIPTNNNQLINGAGYISDYSSPSTGNSITSGTAFQPSSTTPSNIIISSSLGSGLAAVTGTITITQSATQNGTYSPVATDGLILSLLNTSLDRSSATIPVKKGWWVKVTYTTTGVGATISGTYTKWDLQ